MVVYPNIKINIGLNVVSSRTDGYHNIATLFYPVRGICDVLEVVAVDGLAEPFRFSQSGLAVDCDPQQNLCYRAFRLMAERLTLPPLVAHLHKQIPMGAGLGGGSADGAFMLKAINEIVGSPLNEEQLMELALQLGSDCPFFIINKPCVGRGRGELLTAHPISLSGYKLLVVNPGIHVSTAQAYAGISPSPWAIDIDELLLRDVSAWRGCVSNDFEPVVFAQHPRIAEIKDELYAQGAVYASMSGSGSAVFGLFRGVAPSTSHFAGYRCFVGDM